MADICTALYCYDKTASHPVDVSSGGAPALTYCGDGKVTQKKNINSLISHFHIILLGNLCVCQIITQLHITSYGVALSSEKGRQS